MRGRSQFVRADGHWVKRDTATGRILAVKSDLRPWKGIRRERGHQVEQTEREAAAPMSVDEAADHVHDVLNNTPYMSCTWWFEGRPRAGVMDVRMVGDDSEGRFRITVERVE